MNSNVYWIGGSSCSGKSSCAKKLSEKYNIFLYNTDEYAFGKYMFGLEDISRYPAIEKYKNQLCSGIENFIQRDTEKNNMKTIIVNKENSFEKILETADTQIFAGNGE